MYWKLTLCHKHVYLFAAEIATEMMKRGAMMTVLSTLMTALAWPTALLSLTSFIDSKWTIAIDRSFFPLDLNNDINNENSDTVFVILSKKDRCHFCQVWNFFQWNHRCRFHVCSECQCKTLLFYHSNFLPTTYYHKPCSLVVFLAF